MCWKNYFAQPIMKVIEKRKPFKTNNSSEVLYGLHISNAPSTGREKCDERFRKSCTAIHAIHNCAKYNLAWLEGPFYSIIVSGWITSLCQSRLDQLPEGRNVVLLMKNCNAFDFTYKLINLKLKTYYLFKTLTRDNLLQVGGPLKWGWEAVHLHTLHIPKTTTACSVLAFYV